MMMKQRAVLIILLMAHCCPLPAQVSNGSVKFSATLKNEVLTLENAKLSRSFKWNNGNLITISLTDKVAGKVWQSAGSKPDLTLPAQTDTAHNGLFSSAVIGATSVAPEHLEAQVTCSLNQLEIKRVFRLYPDCPAIGCDIYYRGATEGKWTKPVLNLADMVNLEKLAPGNAGSNVPVIEKIELPGRHWSLNAIEFFDVTDRYNTLVSEVKALSYRPDFYRGNLLFATDNTTSNGIFLLKEAPASNVQLNYYGSDFLTDFGTLRVIGAGLNPDDLQRDEWTKGYGFVTGVYSGDEKNRYVALREYQSNLRVHQPGRDEMILMNTWGDRGEDKHISEKFALAELDAAARLGITHFQLDAGWQKGHYGVAFVQAGALDNIWKDSDYWEPHPGRFPNGLDAVVKKGRALGIKICLWFNPSRDSSNFYWQKDAAVLIGMYKRYGITTFKIDGVSLPDKTAEINFRKFLDTVKMATNDSVVFNLDVTAGRRGGYHFFNQYGNLFLENRYTDWQNYYPYTTLRNLWMLAKYVPSQNLQIEFLNKWRNAAKYSNDPFAPASYSFDYLFAITMAAQPLAWFEATGLPAEAFTVGGPVIKKYRAVQADFHSGKIFPIGEEPSGKSWTGFQSVKDGQGYFLIFREDNSSTKATLKTWMAADKLITCTQVIGSGKTFTQKTGAGGTMQFELSQPKSYVLYKYTIK